MTEYDKIIPQTPCADETFFAGANTGYGFISLFSDIFDEAELDALFIVKGGSEAEKSEFMTKIIEAAKKAGAHTCAFLCGYAPDTLDAVTLTVGGRTVAVVDSRSPHPYDPRFPGAVAQVLDLGAFCDVDVLRSERGRIITLATAENDCRVRAYRYLKALATIRSDLRAISARAVDYGKMKAACERLAASVSRNISPTEFTVRRRTFEGITMRGVCAVDFVSDSDLISVSDAEWTYPLFMETFSEALAAAGVSHTQLRDSVEPDIIRGIFIDPARLRVLPFAKKQDNAVKNVNMARFVSPEKLKNSRNKRSFARKCAASVTDGAREALAEGEKYRSELEELYDCATDRAALAKQSEIWFADILSRLT